MEQATKPQTLGYSLVEPVALLAWIYEKLVQWTDGYPWTDDEGNWNLTKMAVVCTDVFVPHSFNMDNDLLLLPCWPRCVGTNLLWGHTFYGYSSVPDTKTNHSIGCVSFPERASHHSQKVRRPFFKKIRVSKPNTHSPMTATFRFVHNTGNLVFEAEHPIGGHFAAHERPEELVGDLRKMFGKHGPAFGVVRGKNGYERKAKL